MIGAVDDLRLEGAALGRYLIGREPEPVALDRYADGCARLFIDPPSPEDRSLLAFVARRPWSLPLLDAACGLVRPRSLLRQKLFLMLAILETIPRHAPGFLPGPRARSAALMRLAVTGVAAVAETLAGLALLGLVRWTD